jgi:hypothetical protein
MMAIRLRHWWLNLNELFVEWNPETLAAFHKNLRLDNSDETECGSHEPNIRSDSDAVAFFNAEEDDDFQDATSPDRFLTIPAKKQTEDRILTTSDGVARTRQHVVSIGEKENTHLQHERVHSVKAIHIMFTLSRLQVTFNKDSRHLKMFVTEMDRTSIERRMYKSRSSTTIITIGNLTFRDCESQQQQTLYREILGLKTDRHSSVSEASSLLQMEILTHPRTRQYASLQCQVEEHSAETGVRVDLTNGETHPTHSFENNSVQ